MEKLGQERGLGDGVAAARRGGVDPQEFAAFAARVFGVAPEAVSLETRRGSLPEWDSVAHLRLVMEAESHFGVFYPLERIPRLETIADFIAAAEPSPASPSRTP